MADWAAYAKRIMSYFPAETVTVTRQTKTRDSGGFMGRTTASIATSPCNSQPIGESYQREVGSLKDLFDREFFFTASVDIVAGDYITRDSSQYKVTEVNAWTGHKRALTELKTGTNQDDA